jgi:hypothetical protein
MFTGAPPPPPHPAERSQEENKMLADARIRTCVTVRWLQVFLILEE